MSALGHWPFSQHLNDAPATNKTGQKCSQIEIINTACNVRFVLIAALGQKQTRA